jgi:hypothetical protein
MKTSVSQIKTSLESLLNRKLQIEYRVSGIEVKAEELHQTVRDHEKMLRKYQWNM